LVLSELRPYDTQALSINVLLSNVSVPSPIVPEKNSRRRNVG
jgi:hypothetical protein